MRFLHLSIITCLAFISCSSPPSGTPAIYKNKTIVDKNQYHKDSDEIHAVLMKMIYNHINPFKPKEQFDSKTQIFIDSIIYSPDNLKAIIFVVTKNSTDKLLKKENNELYFYNAYYLFCSRENKQSPIKVYDYSGFNLVNYYSYHEIKDRLREYCFEDMGTEKGEFNVDDIRFWKSNSINWVINNSKPTKV